MPFLGHTEKRRTKKYQSMWMLCCVELEEWISFFRTKSWYWDARSAFCVLSPCKTENSSMLVRSHTCMPYSDNRLHTSLLPQTSGSVLYQHRFIWADWLLVRGVLREASVPRSNSPMLEKASRLQTDHRYTTRVLQEPSFQACVYRQHLTVGFTLQLQLKHPTCQSTTNM